MTFVVKKLLWHALTDGNWTRAVLIPWALTGPLGTIMYKYKQHILRGVFWTQSNFYVWAFLQQLLTAKSYYLFSPENSIVDVWQGSKYASSPPHIFSDPGDHLDQGDIMFRKGEEEEIFDGHGDTGKMKDAIRY